MKAKFKVWNKRLKSFDTTNKFMIDMQGRLYVQDGSIFIICGDWMEPVFSTTKEDKNGVELFDGDIVKGFGVKRIVTLKLKKYCVYGEVSIFDVDQFHSDFKKIGTKLENPELMEGDLNITG